MNDCAEHARCVLTTCHDLGFALAGICRAEPIDYADELRAWLDAGKHGEMSYMASHLDLRIDPREMLPGAQSIICVADRYHHGQRDRVTDAAVGRIARYARGGDYHKSMKRRLHQLCDALAARHPHEQFRACVDTAPVMEREHAQRAGIGAVGKHTLLIEPGVGSYLLLGEVLTTLDLAPSPSRVGEDVCGGCTRCIDACPTDAITPGSVDATKCISYLTIEHRSAIDEQYHEPMANWIFGCDICQEVCPHNQPTRRSRQADVHPTYAPTHSGFDLLELLHWTEDDRQAAFVGSAMKRAKLDMMKRNALIAAGNALRRMPDEALLRRVAELSRDATASTMVRDTAAQVLRSLERSDGDDQPVV